MWGTTRFFLLASLVSAVGWAATPIPPAPSTDDYLFDHAGLVTPADETTVRALQQAALTQYNSPLVVVTVSSAADYGAASVDALAPQWFDAWNVGTLGLRGGANQGILLLVGVRDRHARIELGGDWGHVWDPHAQAIMNGTIVPHFKDGDFSGGITAGVRELVEMAKAGPHSRPPGDFLERRVRPLTKYSVLTPMHFSGAMLLGFLMLLLGIFVRTSVSGLLIGGGLAVMVFAAFTWALLVVVLLALGSRRRSWSWWDSGGGGGYSGGGGGFSGGSSGGGGASGSW